MSMEELIAEYNEANKKSKELEKLIEKRRKEEDEKHKAQLALEKESRKKALDEAFDNYRKLLDAYVRDYHTYEYKIEEEDVFAPIKPLFWGV